MTEQKANKPAMNPFQRARAESLQVAGDVLANTKTIWGGGKTPGVQPQDISELLMVADWIYGDPADDLRKIEGMYPPKNVLGAMLESQGYDLTGAIEITPDKMPTFFDLLSKVVDDCGQDDCMIHGPANAAKDIKPEDAGMPEYMKYPPFVDAGKYSPGTVMNNQDGVSYVSRRAEGTGRPFWEQTKLDTVQDWADKKQKDREQAADNLPEAADPAQVEDPEAGAPE